MPPPKKPNRASNLGLHSSIIVGLKPMRRPRRRSSRLMLPRTPTSPRTAAEESNRPSQAPILQRHRSANRWLSFQGSPLASPRLAPRSERRLKRPPRLQQPCGKRVRRISCNASTTREERPAIKSTCGVNTASVARCCPNSDVRSGRSYFYPS